MRRRTLEEKLEAIRLVEAGNSPRSVSDRLHSGHHQIYEWLYIYKEKGVSGLENKRICKKNQYSFEKKCEIIREYQESELTLSEIISKHGISSSTLVGWLSKFNKGGKDALVMRHMPLTIGKFLLFLIILLFTSPSVNIPLFSNS